MEGSYANHDTTNTWARTLPWDLGSKCLTLDDLEIFHLITSLKTRFSNLFHNCVFTHHSLPLGIMQFSKAYSIFANEVFPLTGSRWLYLVVNYDSNHYRWSIGVWIWTIISHIKTLEKNEIRWVFSRSIPSPIQKLLPLSTNWRHLTDDRPKLQTYSAVMVRLGPHCLKTKLEKQSNKIILIFSDWIIQNNKTKRDDILVTLL